ncbi:carbamoyltransferase family protein [Phytoactinopolyspora halotolerans]|uniref:Nodulation protein n=1 Tax=Phytoactinopolyspora halotolerans TaxID=1981512 RepID=A0A6L9S461_9ACTN|nr:carbamoyltransferase C-terminal domain-containing protein [Phytoactinopolyspora halotolerans]NED99846.1 nodulation protein [Phytoactinopolyspora halotolerans]
MPGEGFYIGISEGPVDPAAAVVRDGHVVAYAEEERLVRVKHAYGRYPIRALRYCLDSAGVTLCDVAAVGIGWNVDEYTDGTVGEFFAYLASIWPVDHATQRWQRATMERFTRRALVARHHRQWRRHFGDIAMPPITWAPHHFTHAFQASMQAPFDPALVLTVDGSGDVHTTVLWLRSGARLERLREIRMPHSLGWFYAAFTEYLGFDAYDGEYQVMGLAAHGSPDAALAAAVGKVLLPAEDGIEFRLDPSYIHYGTHSWSGRFTDALVDLLGRPPRSPGAEVDGWHRDLAFSVQRALEEAACRLVRWGVERTGVRSLCIGGGVGLNVAMNARLLEDSGVERLFAHPLCADSGAAAGVALAVCARETGAAPEPLTTLALGPEFGEHEIKAVLDGCHLDYDRPIDLAEAVARDLAAGWIVGCFQGRMEAGPRALGQRSILADPRSVTIRDRVNEAVKQREDWRPFGPAVLAEAEPRYFGHGHDSRFMTLALRANQRLVDEAPAVVHTDGTARAQLVHRESSPELHAVLTAFGRLTGVPVLLNTSFNVKGEPMVCTPQDAIRTFFATGLDALAIGPYLVRKSALAG